MLGLPPWGTAFDFHEARIQPLLQHLFVSGDVIEHLGQDPSVLKQKVKPRTAGNARL
jgi:hypothetical protein